MFECGNPSCKKETKQLRKGFCQACYRRQLRNGATDYKTVPPLSTELITEKTLKDGECLIWQGATDKDGYPRYYDPTVRVETGDGLVYVRRWILGAAKGEIVEDTCDNKLCVNIDHLNVATVSTGRKTRAGTNRRRTHCSAGHAFTEENTYIRMNGNRSCRKCNTFSSKKSMYKTKYGITWEEFLAKIEEQNGLCPICSRGLEEGKQHLGAVVDHDHTTMKNRDILHSKCNIGLGHFEDNIDFLLGAIAYLKKHSK